MAITKNLIFSIFFKSTSIFFILLPSSVAHQLICPIESIYQFGDSISDTGNLIREGPGGAFSAISNLPYGETYFHKATGRCSNGLLMIDFLARGLHLPLLNPYLDKDATFGHGVNFAVAGATALDTSFLGKNNIQVPATNSSLSIQLEWFSTHLKSLCYVDTDCKKILKKALFLVGEVGGNDYNYAFLQGKTIVEVKTLVPDVVQSIKHAVKKVIDRGAVRVIVPGNFPIGCLPIYLTTFQSNDTASYDENKCLKGLNEFAIYHNNHLKRGLQLLREEYPGVVILYVDYYEAFLSVLRRAPFLGFEEEFIHKACCGTGGDYNFDMTRMCGAEGVPVCPNPDLRMSWDGIHLTQKAYEHMSLFFLRFLVPEIQCA